MRNLDAKINEYKIYFTKYIKNTNASSKELNELYTEILLVLQKEYKNTSALMGSTLIFYLFLHPINTLVSKTANEIKMIFMLENVANMHSINIDTNKVDMVENNVFMRENSIADGEIFCFTKIDSNVNLLNYHPLVLKYPKQKDKIIKLIVNKLVLSLKIDIFSSKEFFDFYKQIEECILRTKPCQEVNKITKKTTRGGIKKKRKIVKK